MHWKIAKHIFSKTVVVDIGTTKLWLAYNSVICYVKCLIAYS